MFIKELFAGWKNTKELLLAILILSIGIIVSASLKTLNITICLGVLQLIMIVFALHAANKK